MSRDKKILILIGWIEILTGVVTILAISLSVILLNNTKTPNVFIFVMSAACTSSLLGVGILYKNRHAYNLLIYFSSVIILSKILIFFDIIRLNGALEITIPLSVKNIASFIYHSFVILYLSRKKIRNIFIESNAGQ